MSDATIASLRFPSPRKGWDRRINHRPFGRRSAADAANAAGAPSPRFGGMDTVVTDLRRRIDGTGNPLPVRKLPLALCGVAIISLSAVMWASAGYVASHFATAIASLH